MRATDRRRLVLAGCITAGVIGFTTHGPFTSVGSAAPAPHASAQQVEWHHAQRLIRSSGLTVPWDGKVSYSEKTEFCVEAFNGTHHDIRWHHLVPPGFYLKVCQSGDYYVNDGVPFKRMHTW